MLEVLVLGYQDMTCMMGKKIISFHVSCYSQKKLFLFFSFKKISFFFLKKKQFVLMFLLCIYLFWPFRVQFEKKKMKESIYFAYYFEFFINKKVSWRTYYLWYEKRKKNIYGKWGFFLKQVHNVKKIIWRNQFTLHIIYSFL